MRFRQAVVFALCVVSLCLVFVGRLMPAVLQDHDTHATSLVVLVNGADNPNVIPDNLAYAHFILSAVQPAKPSSADTARRAAVQARLGMSSADMPKLDAALKGMHTQLEFIERETQRLSPDARQSEDVAYRIGNLKLQRTRLMDEATTRVLTALSPDGRTKLKTYIEKHVKPRIVIYGDRQQVAEGGGR